MAHGLRLLHRLASWAAVPTVVATAVVLALGKRGSARRRGGSSLGAGIAVSAFAALLTGYLLPWDQLAVREVTVGSGLRGYRVLFDPSVRFVLSGDAELSPGTVLWWLFLHALVVTPALVGLLVVGWRRHRAPQSAPPQQVQM
ncbi:MAG TPA: hypothetical protein VHG90_05995 [Acidimicrobiales bacterium]|nr:hypothetical protein [Acidimicrobiales bacterium]